MEKTFEQRLKSLKTGCIIFGVITGLGLLGNLLAEEKSIISIILGIAMLLMFYFIYKLTKERKILGPILEIILGVLYLIEGLLYLVGYGASGILYIVVAALFGYLILSEGIKFYKTISNNEQ